VGLADDADAAARPITRLRLDGDLHVLAERSQQAHQPLAGEVRNPAIEERRHLRLIDAHQGRCGHLGQTPAPDNLPDMARKLRFG